MGVVREWVTPRLLLVKDDLAGRAEAARRSGCYGNLDDDARRAADGLGGSSSTSRTTRIEGLKVYDKRDLSRPSLITSAVEAEFAR
jgi:hypothetical protein